MNDKADCRLPEPGGLTQAPEQSDDEPGSSSRRGGAPGDHHAAGPSFLQRALGLFKPRNGASLREEIVDALAETAGGAESFSPASAPCSTTSSGCAKCAWRT